ncbi:MAG: hypothetical protein ACYS8W_02650 [Planctomycetota bacterium]|jgi:hypothetical protein
MKKPAKKSKILRMYRSILISILSLILLSSSGCEARKNVEKAQSFRFAPPECPTGARIMTHPGRWVPLRCSFAQIGSDFEGIIRVGYLDSSDIERPKMARGPVYERKIKLALGMKRSFTIHALGAEGYSLMRVELCDSKGRVLTGISPEYRIIPNDNIWVWVVSDTRTPVQLFNAKNPLSAAMTHETTEATHVLPNNLPDNWVGYDSCDALVICRATMDSLTDKQQRALLDWIRSGGWVLVSHGPPGLKGTFLEEHLPVRLIEPNKIEIPRKNKKKEIVSSALEIAVGLNGYSAGEVISFQALAPKGKDTTVLVRENIKSESGGSSTYPILASRPFGAGRITYCACDFTREPFGKFNFDDAFVARAIPPVRRLESFSRFNTYAKAYLEQKPGEPIDPRALIVFALLIYIILVVPVSYLVLKSKKKLKMGVFVTPLVVLAFVGLFTFIGLVTKRANSSANALIILRSGDGETASVDARFGFHTTGSAEISVYTDPAAHLTQMPKAGSYPFRVVEDDGNVMQEFPVDWGGFYTLTAKKLLDCGQIKGKLRLEGRSLREPISNTLGHDLRGCTLVYGRTSFESAFTLDSGRKTNPGFALEEKYRRSDPNRYYGSSEYRYDFTERTDQVLREDINPGDFSRGDSLGFFLSCVRSGNVLPFGPGIHEAGFIGLFDGSDLELDASIGVDRNKTRTIVLGSVPVEFGGGANLLSAMIPGRWITGYGTTVKYHPNENYIEIQAQGQCLREFVVPAGKKATSLGVHLPLRNNYSASPDVKLWDWKKNRHVLIGYEGNVSGSRPWWVPVQDIESFIQKESGRIWMKIEMDPNNYDDAQLKKIDVRVTFE